jgi:divalent metal cation (Fe/Co/Zn/Cd) transporter
MIAEAAVSLFAAWGAKSSALFAFGGDSAIELLSAMMVLWQFNLALRSQNVERRTARIAAALLFILAALVIMTSVVTLLGHSESRSSYMGIAILIGSTAIMPWLASQKRKLSRQTGSAVLRADAAQSGLCAYLAFVALLGLATNTIWHIAWADPVAALAVTPLILCEGKEAFKGKHCRCS